MPTPAEMVINDNIEAARKRSKTQKVSSFIKTQARSALGTTSTLSGTNNATAIVGLVAPKIFSKLLGFIPIVGTVVGGLGEAASKFLIQLQMQKQTEARSNLQMGKWANAFANPQDSALFLQDISSATFKDVIPKMNDALYKVETARKDLENKTKEIEKKLVPLFNPLAKKISYSDAVSHINELAYAYGYYLHRVNRLRMYMDSVQAFMFQYEEGFNIFKADIEKSQATVTEAIESYIAQLGHAKV